MFTLPAFAYITLVSFGDPRNNTPTNLHRSSSVAGSRGIELKH